jgi:mRNA interferase MazF
LQPNKTNGLAAPSSIMIDKITTAHRSKLGQRIGKVSTTEMLQLERGLLVYLGMTG